MSGMGSCGLSTYLPAAPYRHSRVSGNPDGTEKTSPSPPNRRRIPAYAGMTVGEPQPPCYVIPSVAEESKLPNFDPFQDFQIPRLRSE